MRMRAPKRIYNNIFFLHNIQVNRIATFCICQPNKNIHEPIGRGSTLDVLCAENRTVKLQVLLNFQCK